MTMVDKPELFRTASGSKLHLRECPHINGVDVVAATDADVAAREVCTWCSAELSGEGRTYHDTIPAALADMGADQPSSIELGRLLALVEFDTVYVPFSRSYVAVSKDGQSVAWAGKTYVDYRDRPLVTLPDYAPGGGGGAERPDAWGATCQLCWTARSVSGACGCG